ncbi:MAG: hypothetical protein IPK80_20935 [Nannocystis sp.]|nr:hypothetical protein [Nannocystis sp.]
MKAARKGVVFMMTPCCVAALGYLRRIETPTADPDGDPDGAADRGEDEGSVLVGDAEAVEIRARLAELVAQGVVAGLVDDGIVEGMGAHERPRGQKSAAMARPSAAAASSFSSRPTARILTTCSPPWAAMLPRQRAPG